MRAILFILILAIVVIIAVVSTGLVDITQTRGARAPDVDATGNGVVARGGQPPAFDIETGSVSVGARETNVVLPTVQVNPADGEDRNQAAPANNSM